MKIPETVKIGWRNYTVKMIDERRDETGQILDGEIDFSNRIIYIDKTQNIDEQIVVFLHEVVHGIFKSQCHSDWGDNEDLIEAVSEGIFQLMKDNPKLFS